MNTRLISLLAAVIGTAVAADGPSQPKPSDKDLLNYSVGYQIGEDFKRQKMDGKPEALSQGMLDALAGKDPTPGRVEMARVLTDFKKQMLETQAQAEKKDAMARIAAADEVFAKNKADPNVVKLPSGLQYRVINPGTGQPPKASDTVKMKYQASILGGNMFDKTGDDAKDFPINKLIKGWSEAMQLMSPGAKWELFIPASLAYKGHTPLRDRPIKVEVELVAVSGDAKPDEAVPEKEPKAPGHAHHDG
jgi:FKBP-type peptidyl-prolyl cis-trans isomerase FklB